MSHALGAGWLPRHRHRHETEGGTDHQASHQRLLHLHTALPFVTVEPHNCHINDKQNRLNTTNTGGSKVRLALSMLLVGVCLKC